MIKYLTAILMTLFIALGTASAAKPANKKIFAGNYDGVLTMETATGARLSYSPVRFKIGPKGKITGTAYNPDTKKLHKVTGSIGKVKNLFNIRFTGSAKGKFADGTTWTATVEAQKGAKEKVIRGKGKKGAYSGTLSLTNL